MELNEAFASRRFAVLRRSGLPHDVKRVSLHRCADRASLTQCC
jgi:hypothetical protein